MSAASPKYTYEQILVDENWSIVNQAVNLMVISTTSIAGVHIYLDSWGRRASRGRRLRSALQQGERAE